MFVYKVEKFVNYRNLTLYVCIENMRKTGIIRRKREGRKKKGEGKKRGGEKRGRIKDQTGRKKNKS